MVRVGEKCFDDASIARAQEETRKHPDSKNPSKFIFKAIHFKI